MYFSFVLSLELKVSFIDADTVDRLKLGEKLQTHVLLSATFLEFSIFLSSARDK